jgi:ATP-dependent Clp protease adaptor protein ClpS
MAEGREQGDVKVAERTETKEKLARPRRYKVLLHNDDYTTMEFVVWVLQSVFNHDETMATQIMLHVHRTGMGVAGVYSRDVAETRVAQVDALARDTSSHFAVAWRGLSAGVATLEANLNLWCA